MEEIMKVIDAKGKACPTPVILTKNALETANEVTTIVDNDVARKNVEKFAKSKSFQFSTITKEDSFEILIKKDSKLESIEEKPLVVKEKSFNDNNVVLLCASDTFGRGSKELGKVLMKSFFYSLTELSNPPKTIIFMNSGANLSLKDSKVLQSLKDLSDKDVKILTCGTCLNYYEKENELAVGEITNMYTATEIMINSDNLITI
jgi:selenium metabolism protein YedF